MKKTIYSIFIVLSFIILAFSSEVYSAKDDSPKAKPLKTEQAKDIHYVKVDGVVTPVMNEYLITSIDSANASNAGLIVIEIDTPGGLDLSMRDIIKSIMASSVPVAVYVAPSGARAASAGVFITYASHIAVMAPGTNIGSAHPVQMGGGEMDEVMMAKVENDAIAYIKSIAEKKGRNVEWAESAVKDSVNITAEEALELKVIEYISNTKEELFESIDGLEVETVDGKVTIKTSGAKVIIIEMGGRLSFLKAITNPNVAYILMMIGFAGLYFEFSNPGSLVPGTAGAICLILAFYAFQSLSVNYAGLILVLLALILFAAEVMVSGMGVLALAGVISLTLGSIMLFDSPIVELQLSFWVLIPTVLVISSFFLGVVYFAVKVMKQTPVSGLDGFIGSVGKVVDTINGNDGRIFVEGEYWNATSIDRIEVGSEVKVVKVDGMTVEVIKL